MKDRTKFLLLLLAFCLSYLLPFEHPRLKEAILSAFLLLQDYARNHVLLCLVPALFIAGAISAFLTQEAILRYLGPAANKVLAYSVASVSGAILAVCSCTVLPLFAGIYRMGAGIGPASAFLYSGPAINVLAIVLTAKVLGWQIGLARAVCAIGFSYAIGSLMALFFKGEGPKKGFSPALTKAGEGLSLLKEALFMASLIGVLVFVNWPKPKSEGGLWFYLWRAKWFISSGFALSLAFFFVKWLGAKQWLVLLGIGLTLLLSFIFPDHPAVPFSVAVAFLTLTSLYSSPQTRYWVDSTWFYAKTILPLLFGGVMVSGFLLGLPGEDSGIIPSFWVAKLVGGNSWYANLLASVIGAFMYFATLTEVPIVQGLIGAGMGKGPALALLLAGPALSLPSMLVIRQLMGTKKAAVFILLVIIFSTVAGTIFGQISS